MLFVFFTSDERHFCAKYSQPMAEWWYSTGCVFLAQSRGCLSSSLSLLIGLIHLLLEKFLSCRRIKHCREYFKTTQVITSLYRFVLFTVPLKNIYPLFRKTCNGTATMFARFAVECPRVYKFLLLGL